MSREKQIEEMANDYYEVMLKAAKSFGSMSQGISRFYARHLYEKGYRKQRAGEWKLHKDGSGTCSECHFIQKAIWDYDHYQHFCGHCGAKMKGGAE